MATSLIEVVVVIAIVAILASVAISVAVDRVGDARVVQAAADSERIGMAVQGFIQDTGTAPAFKNGLQTSPASEIFYVLETEGTDAIDETASWPTEADQRDRIANHLVRNQPGLLAPSYRRRGEIEFDRGRGWNGPYLDRVPMSDPWNNRYLVNVGFLTPQGVDVVREDLEIPAGGRLAVVVLSAGVNRTIETRFDQLSETFESGGDDIVFRIQ